MLLTSWDRARNEGLLILRLGLGICFIIHGWPKIIHPALWPQLGANMAHLGITFAPGLWGLMAALAEFGGGVLLVLGFLFRYACLALVFDMLVAISFHLITQHAGFGIWSHPLEDGIVFFALLLIGPGRYALDEYLANKKTLAQPTPQT